MNSKAAVGLALTGLMAVAFCGYASIRWIDKDYDFGLMKEAAGPKTGVSRFVNEGPETVSILNVRPSCGCTSAEFSDEPLAPGDTAVIRYTYDPEMRPGKFEKSVNVSLSNHERHKIVIRGNVLGTPESLATLFPVEAGAMRLSDPALNAGDVVMGRAPLLFFSGYSTPLDSITPRWESTSPAVSVVASQPTAGPGDLVTYSVKFDTEKLGLYGPVEVPLEFTADPSADEPETFTLPIRAYVLPDTRTLLLQQGGKNPRAELPASPINIGYGISPSHPGIETEITISNGGKGPLHVLAICAAPGSPASEAVTVGKLPKEIKPGKSARVKLAVDPKKLPEGVFRMEIDVITDDPDHPGGKIYLTGSD